MVGPVLAVNKSNQNCLLNKFQPLYIKGTTKGIVFPKDYKQGRYYIYIYICIREYSGYNVLGYRFCWEKMVSFYAFSWNILNVEIGIYMQFVEEIGT